MRYLISYVLDSLRFIGKNAFRFNLPGGKPPGGQSVGRDGRKYETYTQPGRKRGQVKSPNPAKRFLGHAGIEPATS
jgi:hypothetical protein